MSLKNYELAMTNQTSLTGMSIENCEEIVLQDNVSQVTRGIIRPSYVSIGNFQVGGNSTMGFAGSGCLAQVEYANTGVSTMLTAGGWDLGGPAGPNTHCYIWVVSDGVIGSSGTATKYGIVLSKKGWNGGPDLDPSWTHSLRIGWNFSNAAGNGFSYSLIRNQLRTYFVGGLGSPGTGVLPVVFGGIAPAWTRLAAPGVPPPGLNILNFVSENAGAFGLQLRNYTAGKIIGIAPNEFWGALPYAYINNYPNQLDQAIIVEVFSDTGGPCVWSNDPEGTVSMAYFDDAD